MITPSILRFHYENVLRQDLLLKPNYTHIWRVPRLCELVVVPKARSDFLKNVQLAIENLCGQKCIKIRSFPGSPGKSFRFKQFVLNQESKRKAYVTTHSARSTLRGHIMYKFLEKLVIIISSHSPVRIQRNFIQFHFSMATTFWLKEFPQIKDNFEIFAHIRRVDVTIVTSANTQEETFLSWSGFKKRKEQ